MPHDLMLLNARFGKDEQAALRFALSGAAGRIAMVSSFGAESAALLHLVAGVAPDTPVLFIDTQMLFPETSAYQRALTETLGLTDVRIIGPSRNALFEADTYGILHRSNADACCHLRKTQPLKEALEEFDGWITGRKRFQGGARTALQMFEADDETGRLKINPLASWDAKDIASYMSDHDLPRHPLVERDYPSIGCMPCTGRVAPGESQRAGRWRGEEKTECGIHISNGRK
ncbi:MAG: phosphoadenylyl-sulfate reductase [Alphaproteobacteria bacterium]